jgi:two-component system chemotaxis response regulator CheB
MKTALAVRIRVLIVDSSSLMRTQFTRLLGEDGGIEVVGVAADAYVAREKLIGLKPDVMILDLDLAGIDGLLFLEKVSKHFPTPTIAVVPEETLTPEFSKKVLHAGAAAVLPKPSMQGDSPRAEAQLRTSVKSASHAYQQAKAKEEMAQKKAKRAPSRTLFSASSVNQTVLAIASSTGGTEALKQLFSGMPNSIPATVVVQHMPPDFTASFAEHLEQLSGFEVKEAVDGDRLCANRILLAPGDYHMEIVKRGAGLFIRLHQDPLLHGVRPAADYLLKSVAKYVGSNAVGAVLTGMGRDGADGLLAMRNAGAFTVAQDESSCVVYGMPKAAVECGAVQQVISLNRMATIIARRFKK